MPPSPIASTESTASVKCVPSENGVASFQGRSQIRGVNVYLPHIAPIVTSGSTESAAAAKSVPVIWVAVFPVTVIVVVLLLLSIIIFTVVFFKKKR